MPSTVTTWLRRLALYLSLTGLVTSLNRCQILHDEHSRWLDSLIRVPIHLTNSNLTLR